MRMAVGVDIEGVPGRPHVEAEGRIEFAPGLEIGHRELEPVERVHPELSGAAAHGLSERANLRHDGPR